MTMIINKDNKCCGNVNGQICLKDCENGNFYCDLHHSQKSIKDDFISSTANMLTNHKKLLPGEKEKKILSADKIISFCIHNKKTVNNLGNFKTTVKNKIKDLINQEPSFSKYDDESLWNETESESENEIYEKKEKPIKKPSEFQKNNINKSCTNNKIHNKANQTPRWTRIKIQDNLNISLDDAIVI